MARRRWILALVTISVVVVSGIAALRTQLPGAKPSFLRRAAPASVPQPLGGRIEVIGHRGNPEMAPENTLASIDMAFAAGATMVEIDVHMSRDGVPVVIHDETVDRTTNGKGSVAAMTFAQLSRLDAGSWKEPSYAGERIPSLAAALRAAKGRGRLLLDLKVEGMGAAIANALRSVGLGPEAVLIGTWTATQTSDAVRHLPGAEILMSGDTPRTWDDAFFVHQQARGVTGFELASPWSADFVAAAHSHGMPVYAYTINDEPTMRELVAMGVDGIETDRPALLLRVLQNLRRH